MICQKCGFENTPGDRLCAKCQNDLDFRALDSQMINIKDLELIKDEPGKEQAEAPEAKSRSYKKPLILIVILIAMGAIVALVQPIYDTYVKAEVIGEVISATRMKVERYAREHRAWPSSNNDIKVSIPARSKGDIDIKINHGIIELRISKQPGKKARFLPSVNDRGYVVWECQDGGISRGLLPAMCSR